MLAYMVLVTGSFFDSGSRAMTEYPEGNLQFSSRTRDGREVHIGRNWQLRGEPKPIPGPPGRKSALYPNQWKGCMQPAPEAFADTYAWHDKPRNAPAAQPFKLPFLTSAL